MLNELPERPTATWRTIVLILSGAIAIQIGLILHVGPEFHGDVARAVNFGRGLSDGSLSVQTHFVNTKTWVGPLLSFHLFELAGPWGLKIFNLLAFLGLFGVQYLTGRRLYDRSTLVLALFLFAFYVGTQRNVMAGEPDDMIAALMFSTGLLIFLQKDRVIGAALLMGVGLLFKFWVAIFFGGFLLFLLSERQWTKLPLAGVSFLVPFACLNLIDGFASLTALLWSADHQSGYTAWKFIGRRLLTTGMLPAVLVAGWTTARAPNRSNRLCFFVPIPYFAYVLINRDAWAASAVMMLCMVYFGFLIGHFLLQSAMLGTGAVRRRVVTGVLAVYLVTSVGLALYDARGSTAPLRAGVGPGIKEIPGDSR